MSISINITTTDPKFTEALDHLKKNLSKKRKSLPSTFRKALVAEIEKNPELITMKGKKIILGPSFYQEWIKMQKLDQSGSETDKEHYSLFRKLRKYGIIHNKSSYFPKKLSVISINPTFPSLYKGNFRNIDRYLAAKASLYSDSLSHEQMISDVYLDMRLYQLLSFTARELDSINVKNIIFAEDTIAFIYLEEKGLITNMSVPPYQLVPIRGLEAVAVLKQCRENGTLYPFKDVGLAEKLSLHRDQFYGGMSMYDIKMASQNTNLLRTSPIHMTINSSRKVLSPITISEINELYHSCIPNHLLELEDQRISYAKEKASNETQDDPFEPSFDLEEFDSLTKLLKIKKSNEFKKKVPSVIRELHKYANASDSEPHGVLIATYIASVLSRLEGKNKIKVSTLKEYYYLLRKHLFMKVEDLSNVQSHEINTIIVNLSQQQYKDKSIMKIKSLIRRFFAFHNQSHNSVTIRMSSYPKSLVFDSEIDPVLDMIAENITSSVDRIGTRVQHKILRDKTIVLMGRYTGLRKNELRGLSLSAVYIYGDTLCVDVNSKGMKKLGMRLKTPSAKRRVCVEITNTHHLNIIKEYIRSREALSNNNKFLFLDIPLKKVSEESKNISNDATKKKYYTILSKPMRESVFDEIGSVIQQVTKRYTTFHSLRHSFATYAVLKILKNPNSDPYQLIDLSVKMGHLSPEITLKVYTHASVLDLGGVT